MPQEKQPRIGSIIRLETTDGGPPVRCRIVAKGWGKGGSADLIAVCVEDTDNPGPRTWLVWPLEKLTENEAQ